MILENQSTEGATAKAIEEQTSKLPSDLFLYASLAAMGTSLTLKCLGKSHNTRLLPDLQNQFESFT
jgi:hypothetical protein